MASVLVPASRISPKDHALTSLHDVLYISSKLKQTLSFLFWVMVFITAVGAITNIVEKGRGQGMQKMTHKQNGENEVWVFDMK